MKKIMTLLLGSIFAVSSLASCKKADDSLLSGNWELIQMQKDGTVMQMPRATLTVKKDGNSFYVSGFSGVNNFSRGISLGGGNVNSTGHIASTRMAGPAEAMEAESLFLEIISAAEKYSLSENEGAEILEIFSEDEKNLLRFKKFSLTGTLWNVSGVKKNNAIVFESEGIPQKLVFDEEGKAYADTGINRVLAEYADDKNSLSLSFSNIASTRAAGSPEDMEAESVFLKCLEECASYSLSGMTLTLYDVEGNTLLVLSRQDLI